MTSYVEYSIFTNEKFDPRQYANSLLLSTNDKDEQHLDFNSAENKLKFDLEEVASAVKLEVERNWEDLLERTELSASTVEDVQHMESSLKSLSSTYESLSMKAVVPFETAEPLYEALVNLASTSALLRSLRRYLAIYSRIDTVKGITESTDFLMDIDKCVSENRALMQLRIVISNLPRLDTLKAQVTRECTSAISQFDNISHAVTALNQLDRALLLKTYKATVSKALNDAAQQLKAGLEVTTAIKRMQSMDNGKAVNTFVDNLRNAFSHMGKHANAVQQLEDECPPELVQVILEDLFDASANIKQYFWREVSGRISRITRDVCRADQWILRTLRAADIGSIISQGLSKGTMEYSVVYGSLSRR